MPVSRDITRGFTSTRVLIHFFRLYTTPLQDMCRTSIDTIDCLTVTHSTGLYTSTVSRLLGDYIIAHCSSRMCNSNRAINAYNKAREMSEILASKTSRIIADKLLQKCESAAASGLLTLVSQPQTLENTSEQRFDITPSSISSKEPTFTRYH